MLRHSEVVFVAIETPHEPRFEGVTRLPEDRADFDYQYLISAMRSISEATREQKIIAIISTVLPGTISRGEFSPYLSPSKNLLQSVFYCDGHYDQRLSQSGIRASEFAIQTRQIPWRLITPPW